MKRTFDRSLMNLSKNLEISAYEYLFSTEKIAKIRQTKRKAGTTGWGGIMKKLVNHNKLSIGAGDGE